MEKLITTASIATCMNDVYNCYDKLYARANIPPIYSETSFDTFLIETEEQRKAHAKCTQNLDRSLYLCGPVGTGKTHLAVSILKKYLADGFAGMFINAVRLLERLRPPFNEAELMDMAETVEVLVLDDFGMQKDTDWTYEQLACLLNERYMSEKLTLVTSNLTLEMIEADGIQGKRIASRIKEMCDILLIRGDDYRDKIARSKVKRKTVNIMPYIALEKGKSDANVSADQTSAMLAKLRGNRG